MVLMYLRFPHPNPRASPVFRNEFHTGLFERRL
jgi:hypothetical protein